MSLGPPLELGLGIKHKRLGGPVLVPSTPTVIYTVGASTATVVKSLHVNNPTGSPVTFTLYLGAHEAFNAYTIAAHRSLDWQTINPLNVGETIVVSAGTNNVLTCTVSGTQQESSLDGLEGFRAIGNCELLLDAIGGMVGNGTNVTAITDLSGHNLSVTLPVAPLMTATTWNSLQPGLQFVRASGHWLEVAALSVPQPFTVVALIQDFDSDLQDEFLWFGATLGRPQGATSGLPETWYISDSGVGPQITGPQSGLTQGRRVRIDVANNATSLLASGSTEFTGSIGASDGLIDLKISLPGLDLTSGLALFAVYSKALSAAERARVIQLAQARYSGINPT